MVALKDKDDAQTPESFEDMAMFPGILADHQIRELAKKQGMIEPIDRQRVG